MEDAKIAEIKAAPANAGRELLVLTSKNADVVFRVPNDVEMDAWQSRYKGDRANLHEANKSLVGTCLAFPALAELQEILKRKPVLLTKWAGELYEAAGGNEEVEVKKQ